MVDISFRRMENRGKAQLRGDIRRRSSSHEVLKSCITISCAVLSYSRDCVNNDILQRKVEYS